MQQTADHTALFAFCGSNISVPNGLIVNTAVVTGNIELVTATVTQLPLQLPLS